MAQDIFVDVEQGYSTQDLHVLNKAVDAFAEFDPLVSRVLHLAREGNWPREFALVTIAYYLLHRHKEDYHGNDATAAAAIPPVRITVQLEPATVSTLKDLVSVVEAHPPMEYSNNGHAPVCAVCHETVSKGHRDNCGLRQAIARAERLLTAA